MKKDKNKSWNAKCSAKTNVQSNILRTNILRKLQTDYVLKQLPIFTIKNRKNL